MTLDQIKSDPRQDPRCNWQRRYAHETLRCEREIAAIPGLTLEDARQQMERAPMRSPLRAAWAKVVREKEGNPPLLPSPPPMLPDVDVPLSDATRFMEAEGIAEYLRAHGVDPFSTSTNASPSPNYP